MRKSLLFAVVTVLAVGLALPNACRADSLLIGVVSFDSGVYPGVNSFDLYNLTGGEISPDGIADNEMYSGTLTVNVQGIGEEVFSYNNVDIYGNNAMLAMFSPSANILSATLSLTLSNSTGVNIYDDDGNPAVANLEAVADTPLPLNGGSELTPCDGSGSPCSEASVYVNTAPSVAVTPESSTFWLVLIGLGGAMAMRNRWQRKLQS
jgi:hypothetical protein